MSKVPDARRTAIARELLPYGLYWTEVGSEFEWKAVRRLARAIGRRHGIRVHSRLVPPHQEQDWPRRLALWNPDFEVTEADMRRAALAMDAFLQGDLTPRR